MAPVFDSICAECDPTQVFVCFVEFVCFVDRLMQTKKAIHEVHEMHERCSIRPLSNPETIKEKR